jgi:hypothetical protein
MDKADFEAEIERLASMEYVDYCRESKEGAKRLGITKRELDRCVKETRRKINGEHTLESGRRTVYWNQAGDRI